MPNARGRNQRGAVAPFGTPGALARPETPVLLAVGGSNCATIAVNACLDCHRFPNASSAFARPHPSRHPAALPWFVRFSTHQG